MFGLLGMIFSALGGIFLGLSKWPKIKKAAKELKEAKKKEKQARLQAKDQKKIEQKK